MYDFADTPRIRYDDSTGLRPGGFGRLNKSQVVTWQVSGPGIRYDSVLHGGLSVSRLCRRIRSLFRSEPSPDRPRDRTGTVNVALRWGLGDFDSATE